MTIPEEDKKYDNTDDISNLMEIAARVRPKMVSRNYYQDYNNYNISHPDAQSDGDRLGREQKNDGGTIGTSIDIERRKVLTAINFYSEKRNYKVVE